MGRFSILDAAHDHLRTTSWNEQKDTQEWIGSKHSTGYTQMLWQTSIKEFHFPTKASIMWFRLK